MEKDKSYKFAYEQALKSFNESDYLHGFTIFVDGLNDMHNLYIDDYSGFFCYFAFKRRN